MSEANTDPTDIKRPQFELREDGEVHFNKKGKSQLLAKYDSETGVLVFESFAIDHKYREQVCRAIREDVMTGELSGNAIKAFAIAGRPVDRKKPGEPPAPKKNKQLGDKTPEFVRWLFKWRPWAAYARYGVFLDSNNEPITAPCIRVEQGLIQADSGKALKVFGDGKDALTQTVTESEEGILALRATCMTFTKAEQVSAVAGEEPEDDDEPLPGGDEDGDKPAAAPKPRRAAKQLPEGDED